MSVLFGKRGEIYCSAIRHNADEMEPIDIFLPEIFYEYTYFFQTKINL